MTSNPVTSRVAWNDRWSAPKLDDLLEPLKSDHRKRLQKLIAQLEQLEGARQSLIWYGPSWKWTIHYTINRANGHGHGHGHGNGGGEKNGTAETLCYLVPNVDSTIICVPLDEAMIDALPKKRLSKFIREGIRAAKRAVQIHWATWSPSSESEIEQLMDLVKRKHNHYTRD